MAQLNLSMIQIIATFIGSGMSLFVVNSIVANVDQPHILVHTDQSIGHNGVTEHIIQAQNDGRSSATHLVFTVFYPNSIITNYTVPFQSQNITLERESTSALVGKMDRLSQDAFVILNTLTKTKDLSPKDNSNTTIAAGQKYFISAAYDQGSTYITNLNLTQLDHNNSYSIPSRDYPLVIFSIIAVISFSIAFSQKRIKAFRVKFESARYLSQVIKEMARIRNKLSVNIMSTDIFNDEIWSSKEDSTKHQIFKDHNDFRLVSIFYATLRERHDKFKDTTSKLDNNIKKYNQECLLLADEALRRINWDRYHDPKYKTFTNVFTVLAIIASSAAVFILFEVLAEYLFVSFTGEITKRPLTFYLLILLLRGGTSFLLARDIISFRESRLRDIDLTINERGTIEVTKTRNWSVKLLFYSFIIMGVPILSVATGLHVIDSQSVFATFIPLTFIVVDISRMTVLVLIMPWIVSKRSNELQVTV